MYIHKYLLEKQANIKINEVNSAEKRKAKQGNCTTATDKQSHQRQHKYTYIIYTYIYMGVCMCLLCIISRFACTRSIFEIVTE